MNKQGISHIIECTCILPQYAKQKIPTYHKFIVFSVIDENDNIIPKFAQCNNCNVIHRVTEVGRSSILQGRDELKSLMTIDDIALSLPDRLTEILKSHDCQLYIWEHAKFILDESLWGSHIIIASDTIDDIRSGKILVISGKNSFGVTQFNE